MRSGGAHMAEQTGRKQGRHLARSHPDHHSAPSAAAPPGSVRAWPPGARPRLRRCQSNPESRRLRQDQWSGRQRASPSVTSQRGSLSAHAENRWRASTASTLASDCSGSSASGSSASGSSPSSHSSDGVPVAPGHRDGPMTSGAFGQGGAGAGVTGVGRLTRRTARPRPHPGPAARRGQSGARRGLRPLSSLPFATCSGARAAPPSVAVIAAAVDAGDPHAPAHAVQPFP